MKFLVDAQLPRRLVSQLREAGHEAVHTLDLPSGNRTPDSVINELSASEGYVVVTKDADFVNSFHLHRRPRKLLLVSTGNPKLGIGSAVLIKAEKYRRQLRPFRLHRGESGRGHLSRLRALK